MVPPTIESPTLVATAHGTDNVVGQEIVSSIVSQVAQLLPGTRVLETYVDVQYPQINEVLSSLAADEPSIVVPLLLSTGYHTVHDIYGAVEARSTVGTLCQATATLGPHPLLAAVQADRILESSEDHAHIILVAAGSSDVLAQTDVEAQVKLLSNELVRRAKTAKKQAPTISVAYLSAAQPTVTEALSAAAESVAEGMIVLNSYLLAPGFFQRKLERLVQESEVPQSRTVVTAPLGDDARLARVVLERYSTALEDSLY